MHPHPIHFRDPIHGSIRLSPRELQVVEHPLLQRLRGIKQLGFADFAFPGATHSRFSHTLGAMEVGSRAFDAVFGDESQLPAATRERFRQTIRLALLLHDIGHAPLSHATESCMPLRTALGIDEDGGARGARATHEDYTIKLLLASDLTALLRAEFGDQGIDPRDVARLISGRFDERRDAFRVDGVDFGPLLRQLVSGELDADRMDYLQRDSYYAGVAYGKFDDQWLINNLTQHVTEDGAVHLALLHRAIFAFEDFLLSRYHMFISVYYHHTAVGLDTMLARFIDEEPDAFVIPTDPADFVNLDDVSFWNTLRGSQSPWAQRIVTRQLYRRVVELNADDGVLELPALKTALAEAGIDYFISRDESVLSHYYGSGIVAANPIFVVNRALRRASRIDSYSKLFARYAQPTRLTRLYCRPDQLGAAQDCLRDCVPAQVELQLPIG